ncbi:MAG: secretion protein snm4 [Actinomycetia bacterium]|nr:secretion protein snm4 [Actinomycetes bacterium]
MSPITGPDLCRVTVVGPTRRVDLSVPTDMPFAELFPTVLRYAGEDLANVGLAHGGWVLQRLDEAPFDPGSTPAQAGLRDGELLHLRPGMSLLREPTFDDVADVVATGINDRSDRWRPEFTRRFALGTAAVALLAGTVPILIAGPRWVVPSIASALVGLLLLVASTTLSRAVGDSAAGSVLGYVALPYAFLAGILGPARSTTLGHLGAPHLMAGFAAVVLVAMVAAFAIADGLPIFLGIAFAALMGTIGAAIAFAYDGTSAAGVAAVTIAITLAFTPLIPTIAFRLARVTLPPVPASAEELRSDTMLVNGSQVLRRTAHADRFVTGMATGIALVGLVGQIPLALSSDGTAQAMCAVTALTLLLRSRVFRGRTQRLWFLLTGMAGFVMLAVGTALGATGQTTPMAMLAVLVVGALVLVAVGSWLPGNRPSPFWARSADILEILTVIALVTLAPGVIGLYGRIRGLAG